MLSGVSNRSAQTGLSFQQSLLRYLENDAALDQGDRALLLRWAEDGRANEVWDTILAYCFKHNGGTILASSFIGFVLSAKKMAVLEDEIISEKDVARWRRWFLGKIKTLPDDMLFPFLELVIARHGPAFRSFVSSPRDVRSDRSGSRPKTLFIRAISSFVRDFTGKRLDKEVAVITEIAFDIESVDADTVRKARSD